LNDIVVVGGSLAGLRAVETLRGAGYDGGITVVGDEPHLPYDRPPLSKQVLSGKWDADKIAIGPVGRSIDDLEADWRLGARATGLDLAGRSVAIADGSTVGFDGLVIATGARVRTLPGQPELRGLHVLRTIDDGLALRADLERSPQRVVVVGGGFIGAEVAATARMRGLDVTILEALPVPLQRVFGDEIGGLCRDIHEDHGVEVRVSTAVDEFLSDGGGNVTGVALGDGTTVVADVVVVGVGVIPNTDWLAGSGLTIDNGVVCDATCLAAPGVVAAGDVARWPNHQFGGELMRVEHWENAQEQGSHAARRLLAGATGVEPYAPVPWFWSDQYDRKLQLAGHCRPDDDMRVVEGSFDERRFVALFGRAGRLVAVLGMNRPRHVMEWRTRIVERMSWEDALAIADSST
jgi:NADPH-dependent 2,4-dienoyl-CoA reductase/sulfur reductase-like enzyme